MHAFSKILSIYVRILEKSMRFQKMIKNLKNFLAKNQLLAIKSFGVVFLFLLTLEYLIVDSWLKCLKRTIGKDLWLV